VKFFAEIMHTKFHHDPSFRCYVHANGYRDIWTMGIKWANKTKMEFT